MIERLATPADISALHALIERTYRGETAKAGWTHEADLLGGQRTDVTTLAGMLGDPAQRILVAAGESGFEGCVAVSDKGAGLAYLGLLTVDPLRQASGLGRRLLAAAEDLARQAFGAATMEMTVIVQRAELVAWYERRGYRQTGERRPFPYGDTRFGLPVTHDLAFVVMSRELGDR